MIARRFAGMTPSTRMLEEIVLCYTPTTLVIVISIIVPGFMRIDAANCITYSVTSAAFLFRPYITSSWPLLFLSTLELFNVATLMLLSVYLRQLSGLPVPRAVAINFAFDLILRVLARILTCS
jgi:hypothetical protein